MGAISRSARPEMKSTVYFCLPRVQVIMHSVLPSDYGVTVNTGVYTLCRNVAPSSAVKPFSPSSATAWYWPSCVRLIAVHSTSPVWRVPVPPSLVC